MPLDVHVVTPERELWHGESDFVSARPEGGEVGIMPGHAPFLGTLKHGTVKVQDNGGEHFFAVHGGFIQVFEDKVTILGTAAELASEIDIEEARRNREACEEQLRQGHTAEAWELLQRSEARLRTAGAAGLIAG
jgi:F-type H+-transporting ATPase subunit epsilon